jgi:type VI secretion system protein VasD
MKIFYKNLSIIFVSFMLHGCISDAIKDTGDILKNIASSEDDKKASKMSMMLYADDAANINESNEPAPITVMVLQMTNDLKMITSDYASLTGDVKSTLGKTYLNHEEYIVQPGSFTNVEEFPIEKNAKYIGIVASYRSIEDAVWRGSVKIEDQGEQYAVHVVLSDDGLKVEVQ